LDVDIGASNWKLELSFLNSVVWMSLVLIFGIGTPIPWYCTITKTGLSQYEASPLCIGWNWGPRRLPSRSPDLDATGHPRAKRCPPLLGLDSSLAAFLTPTPTPPAAPEPSPDDSLFARVVSTSTNFHHVSSLHASPDAPVISHCDPLRAELVRAWAPSSLSLEVWLLCSSSSAVLTVANYYYKPSTKHEKAHISTSKHRIRV
jgi:hypothetical protein